MIKIGALEAGGTKMVLAVYDGDGNELDRLILPTEAPDRTLPAMIGYFRDHQVDALGVGSFGPLDLNPLSPTYGWITTTPKLEWRNTPLLPKLLDGRDIPAGIDTDVNAAIMAEVALGAAQGCDSAVYVTIGTGIGGGVYVNRQTVHGMLHPEIGHMLVKPHPEDPIPRGVCPYHESCLEGLAAGPAIGARANCDARTLADDHPVFVMEAHYLAQMCANLMMTLSPQRIVLGGGVMQRSALLPLVRKETLRLLGGYLQSPLLENMDAYIVAPKLYPVSGLVGSWLIGKQALDKAH